MSFTIAIDGPSGAGKSTIASELANRLQLIHIDTGAMYRGIAYGLQQQNIDPQDEVKLHDFLTTVELSITKDQEVWLNQQNITEAIRSPKISQHASYISTFSPIRKFLVAKQQALATQFDCVLDGRDIGSVVLPKADVKFFVTATPEIRAKRRLAQLKNDNTISFDELLIAIKERDYQDSHRADSPLKIADDAIVIDNSTLNLTETVDLMLKYINERRKTCD